jgi:hypothetical protein
VKVLLFDIHVLDRTARAFAVLLMGPTLSLDRAHLNGIVPMRVGQLDFVVETRVCTC